MLVNRIALPSGRHCGLVASVDRRVTRCASPPLAKSSTYTCDWSSPSRRAVNANRRLSGLQSTPPSPPFELVSRRGSALPSVGTSQRSLTCSPSVYDGSVTLNTIQRPSGLIAGELTRFMRKTSSCVMVWRCCAASGAEMAMRITSSRRILAFVGGGVWRARRIAPPDVNEPFDFRVDDVRAIYEGDAMRALDLFPAGRSGADVVDFFVRQHEAAIQRGPRRFPKPHGCTLVPHEIVPAEILDQHHHVDTVTRGIHAPAEHRADIVPGAPAERQLDADLAVVVRDIRDPGAGAPVGGKEVESPAEEFTAPRFRHV